MSTFDVDLFADRRRVGGVARHASRRATARGVMVAEEYRVGGTCVIRGCVPKKLMVYASRFADDFEEAAGFGWTVTERRFDWATLIANKDKEIMRLEGVYRSNLERAGVEIVDSRAVIEDAHTIRILKTNEAIRARCILVAVGAHPVLEPPIPGGELGITSNEVFHLETFPERVLVVGAGYIAVEFAGIFNGLGSDVTLLHRGDRLLRGFDEDVREALSEAYAVRGIDLALGLTVASTGRPTASPRLCPMDRRASSTRCSSRRDAAEHGTPGPRKRRRRHRCRGCHHGRCLFADPDPVDLCGRRRDEPGRAHAGRHPRGPRLCGYGVRRTAHHGGPLDHPDGGLLHT